MTPLRKLIEQATPGPWEWDDRGSTIFIDSPLEGLRVSEIDVSYDEFFDRDQCRADARLIALAPQLADLLDRTVAQWHSDAGCLEDIGTNPRTCELCELYIEANGLLSTSQPGDKT